MATWRLKAYELFGFTPGSYSFARGKVQLFADLAAMTERADAAGDDELLGRIVEYVCWAAAQGSEQLDSAVELAYLLPVFRDQLVRARVQRLMPAELFSAKWNALMEDQPEPGT